jgi:hypothetical protein
MHKERALIAGGVAIVVLWWLGRPKGTVTTWAGFDLGSIGGMVDYPDRLQSFARAIARAEGFYVPGSVPQRANNPGAIKVPNWTGPTLGEGISAFQSEDAGWSALYRQLMLVVSGGSNYYNLDMSIADMAQTWTGGPPIDAGHWAQNVADAMNASTTDPLWKVMV